MSDHWTRGTVADIAAPTRNALVGGPFGSELVATDYAEDGVPVVRGSNMGNGRWVSGEFAFVSPQKAQSLAANLARPGDIVFTQRGTLGQVALVPPEPYGEYLISQSQMKLTVDGSRADALFVYYAFTTAEQQQYVRRNAIQTGVPHTNLGILRTTPLLLPPLCEQRAIARVLGSLDDKIELNRRMNQTLEAITRAVFKSWFVDFDPVHAKAGGKLPPGITAETAALFPDAFEGSGADRVPKGWSRRSVYELAEVLYGAPFSSEAFNGDQRGMPLIRIRDLATHQPTVCTPEQLPSQTVIRAGDIVVGMDGEFRVHHWRGEPALLNQRLCSFRPGPGVPRVFLSEGLKAPMAFFERSKVGTTVSHLGKADIDTVRLLAPPGPVLNAFAAITDPLLDRSLANAAESRSLAAIRDALLPKLMSGEVRVKDGGGRAEGHSSD